MGWNLVKPKGAAYVWFRVPPGYTSEGFTDALLEEAGVALTPGSAFGESGEGFARISLTASDADVRGAMEQLSDFLQSRPSLVPDAGADGSGTRSDRPDTLPRRIQWERGCS